MKRMYSHLSANNIAISELKFPNELAMEGYLIEHVNVLSLTDDDLDIIQIIDYELPGKKTNGNQGRIDLLALYSNMTFGIVELKKGMLKMDHCNQLSSYFSTQNITEIYNKNKVFGSSNQDNQNWIGVLIGSDIEEDLRQKIMNGEVNIQDGKIPIAAIVIKRYRSDEGQMYVISDTYFNEAKGFKDKSKYSFLDQQNIGKSRLVHCVVKEYVRRNPQSTYSELADKVFKKELQGSLGVICTKKEAENILSNTGYKRHYLNPEDIIETSDSPIAVCNQWGKDNIDRFIKAANDLFVNDKIKKNS